MSHGADRRPPAGTLTASVEPARPPRRATINPPGHLTPSIEATMSQRFSWKWAPSAAALVLSALTLAAPHAQTTSAPPQTGANASGKQTPPRGTDSQLPQASVIPSITDKEATGNRLWVFLFDTASIQGPDTARARTRALNWITFSMTDDDLVAVMSISSSLKLIQNFTANVTLLRTAIAKVTPTEEFNPDATGAQAEADEMSLFNNDVRMRGIRQLCSGLASIDQKKALMFFTAIVERPGYDNLAEVHATTETCKEANTTINSVDVHDAGLAAR
jgi:VWFA-related protein